MFCERKIGDEDPQRIDDAEFKVDVGYDRYRYGSRQRRRVVHLKRAGNVIATLAINRSLEQGGQYIFEGPRVDIDWEANITNEDGPETWRFYPLISFEHVSPELPSPNS